MENPVHIYKAPNGQELKTHRIPMPPRLSDEKWLEACIAYMEERGWIKDRDDENYLGFSMHDGDRHWIRDYDKKERRFVQYDGNQKINMRVTNGSDKSETTA